MARNSDTRKDNRKQIENSLETKLGSRFPLCNEAHEIYELLYSGTPLIILRTDEEQRAVDNVLMTSFLLDKEGYHWSPALGLYRRTPVQEDVWFHVQEEMVADPNDKIFAALRSSPIAAVSYYLRNLWQHPVLGTTTNPSNSSVPPDWPVMDKGSVFVLKDAHLFLSQNQPVPLRMLKELVASIQWRITDRDVEDQSLKNMSIVITAPYTWAVPDEIKEFAVDIQMGKPNEDESRMMIYGIYGLDPFDTSDNTKEFKSVVEQEKSILHATTGLTLKSLIDSMKISIINKKFFGENAYDVDLDILREQKARAIQVGSAVSYEEPKYSMEDVGGHATLKTYLTERAIFFDPNNPIQDRLPAGMNLPRPKGVLMVGIPGCGKSLEAKAMASQLKVPLITLDMGSVFTGLVGGSEQKIREALRTAEECAPCVMRIEEIEKALSGSGSSNFSDGGTTSRVFQTLLNWLQECTAPVFVVATANDITQLPPELLRKGRFDEIFFVDLPGFEDRKEIFKIHLRLQAGLDEKEIKKFDLDKLALISRNFSGAEIEVVVQSAIYKALYEFSAANNLAKMKLAQKHIEEAIGGESAATRTFKILHDSQKEKLDTLRNIAKSSWLSASDSTPETETVTMKTGKTKKTGAANQDFFADEDGGDISVKSALAE
jgi:ATP-dependent 26S proteasome regulatory subunit